MISYVKGSLIAIDENVVVVEAGSLGYNLFMPLSALEKLPRIGTEVLIYTYLQVREDAMNLYGFLNRQDLGMFKQLIGVNGIGPKVALGILSALSPDELRLAIISGDTKTLSRAPGVGTKTAQRMILDLKDRIRIEDIQQLPEDGTQAGGGTNVGMAGKEAIAALVALGYSNMEATKAVRLVTITEDMTSESVLKASLKHLTF